MKKNKPAFTLVELLIVSSLFLLIALVLDSVLRNTLNIWHKLRLSSELEELNILFDKLSFDLKNSFKFKGIVFLGEKKRFEFPCLVNSPLLKRISVGKVIYEFLPINKALNKYQLDYSGIYTEKSPDLVFSLKNVEDLEFSYYVYDQDKKAYFWQEELKENKPFSAVRIRVKISGQDFFYTIDIPYA